jgi:hypothetical protein
MVAMKTKLFVLMTIALPLLVAAQGRLGRQDRQDRQIRQRQSTNLNVGVEKVTNCGDLRITFDRRPAITEESEILLPASQVSTLRAQTENSGMYVAGWDRSEYSVKTCKGVPDDDPDAHGTLRDIVTSNTNGQISLTGPSDRQWIASLIIMAPRLTALDLQTRNGPMSVHDLAGNIHVRASNGPISLDNVGGSVDAATTNGPIALKRGSGDQRISATNGPISVALSGSGWDGPGLQVTTQNGPLALSIPDGYNSGVAIQTSSRSPISCTAAACADLARVAESPTTLRFGSGNPVVKLSTSHGPLAIRSAKE